MTKKKRCGKCGRMLPVSKFSTDPGRPNGIACYCRVCVNENTKLYYRNITMRKLMKDLPNWTAEKLTSEIEWLKLKLFLIDAELESRV